MKRLKSIFINIASWLFFLPTMTLAQDSGSYDFANNSGLEVTANKAGFTDALKALQPENLASKLITQVLAWLGVLFLGLAIYSGITWMTAQGNDQKVEKAKNILIASISGLIVVLAAYAISYFVVSFFTHRPPEII